jgi:voltage-gated potassium channel
MLLGIAMFAVPAGILASGFAAEVRKREFVVTWQMVANLPLFARLDVTRIAEIARLLKRQVVPGKYVIVRRGETADSMFFIMSGEVEVDVQPIPRRFGRGQYFRPNSPFCKIQSGQPQSQPSQNAISSYWRQRISADSLTFTRI